jgi:tripartite-type tricarboxylate transporter receptor subunit TctC
LKNQRRCFLKLAAGAAAVPALARIAPAQTYPSRPITMVVALAAGGSSDLLARILAERMGAVLGQTVVVENAGGASGSIGVGRVARAAPDGYTLSFGHWGTHVVNGAIYQLPYNVLTDFEPIALLVSNPQMILARKSMPADDLAGLVAWLKANPDRATQGTSGPGGPAHVTGVYFQRESGTRYQFVPYRGLGPAMQDLVAGQIDIMVDNPATALALIRNGSIKAYAVMTRSRLAAAPEIPTADEAGLPGFFTSNWFGLWAPARTPQSVVARLNAAVVAALAEPAVRARLGELAQEIFPREQQTPQALAALQRAEIDKWWPIIKAANIKGE